MIKWRKHELVMISILTGLPLASCFVEYSQLGSSGQMPVLANAFRQHHQHFNYFINHLLPQMMGILCYYGAYLWFNLVTVPLFRRGNKANVMTYFGAAFQLVALAFLLALGINAATWLGRPYYFSYRGFASLSSMGYNDSPLSNLFFGFGNACTLAAIYTAYAAIREFVIFWLERSGNGVAYRSLVVNRITLFFVIMVTVPVAAATFNLISDSYYTIFVALFLPGGIGYISKMYRLFPSREVLKIDWWLLGRLVGLTFACSLAYPVFALFILHGFNFNLWLISWGMLAVVVTPAAYFLYRSRGDEIFRLRNVEKALARSKADLYFLRSRINPHFLFNALNTLYGTALNENAQRTAEGIQMLGDMMRFMLHDNQLDFIPMEKEIAYLKNYISLQKLRIGQAKEVEISAQLDEQHCNNLISPMLLIPLVENAFKHGISLTQKSWITITLKCDDAYVQLEVRNSIHTSKNNDPEKAASGIGLKNVRERLAHFYPGRYELDCQTTGNEFVASLTVKIALSA